MFYIKRLKLSHGRLTVYHQEVIEKINEFWIFFINKRDLCLKKGFYNQLIYYFMNKYGK